LKHIGKFEATAKLDGSVGGSVTFNHDAKNVDESDEVPVFINTMISIVKKILAKSELKVWLMLDRLDEVFPRRSEVETKALRSLLKCSLSFHDELLRLKIFLRDDIFESVTDTAEGFTALTHVADRSSNNLNWTKDQILHLIVKRSFANETVLEHYSPDVEEP
jgi:hypothetical protein